MDKEISELPGRDGIALLVSAILVHTYLRIVVWLISVEINPSDDLIRVLTYENVWVYVSYLLITFLTVAFVSKLIGTNEISD